MYYFIDEIDAVARRRGTGMGGGHDEREQTLNQMLVEMDGFGVNSGIIVIAATNRVDILDPAILRPGRFDRKVAVGKPDVKGRREILDVHVKGKPIGDDVDLDTVAQTTAGFTGADLENLMNEAAIYAAKNGRKYIIQADIERSFIKVGIGAEKKSKVISDKEKKITAYHEAGHAILFMYCRMLDLSIQFQSFLQEWAQQVIQCLSLKRMRCLIPKERCYSRLSWDLADVLQKNLYLKMLLQGHHRILSSLPHLQELW